MCHWPSYYMTTIYVKSLKLLKTTSNTFALIARNRSKWIPLAKILPTLEKCFVKAIHKYFSFVEIIYFMFRFLRDSYFSSVQSGIWYFTITCQLFMKLFLQEMYLLSKDLSTKDSCNYATNYKLSIMCGKNFLLEN